MMAAPKTCHHALTLSRSRTRSTPNVFNRPCKVRMMRKVMYVRVCVTSSPVVKLKNANQVVAQPKSIAAVTANSPRKLYQPVNQAHCRLFLRASRAAQKYSPPAVGYAEQISAMPIPTRRTKTPTSGQPMLMAIGPPETMAIPYDVIAPARIEMMENEMAKFEKPLNRRCNSCLYP